MVEHHLRLSATSKRIITRILPSVILSALSILIIGRWAAYTFFTECVHSVYSRHNNPDITGTAWLPVWLRDIVSFRLLPLLGIAALVRAVYAFETISLTTPSSPQSSSATALSPLLSKVELQVASPRRGLSSSSDHNDGHRHRCLSRHTIQVIKVSGLLFAVFLFTFIIAIWLLQFAKVWTGDRSCSREDAKHFNGVSGHAMVTVWALAWLYYISQVHSVATSLQSPCRPAPSPSHVHSHHHPNCISSCSRRSLSAISSFFAGVLQRLFLFGSTVLLIQMYHTIVYAYHTLQQIVLGASFGAVLVAISLASAEYLRGKVSR